MLRTANPPATVNGKPELLTLAAQLRRLPPQTSQENRNLATRQIHMHLLRQGDREASVDRDLELQSLQEGIPSLQFEKSETSTYTDEMSR